MNGTIYEIRPDKGFAFVTGDDGQNYFAHTSEFNPDEWAKSLTGERVQFQSEPDNRGLRAVNVRLIPDDHFQTGIVKYRGESWGFITPDAGAKDVFFHKNGLRNLPFGDSLVSRRVKYRTATVRGKIQAVGVQPAE